MKIGILARTEGGQRLARQLAAGLPGSEVLPVDQGVKKVMAENWHGFDGLVCVMAAGIVVRAIAPLLLDKASDPCVLVVDELGEHVISLLSGHLGGGNELAQRVARCIGGRAVLTTASDVLGLVALDLWARAQGLVAADKEALTRASARLVNKGELKLYAEVGVESLPAGLKQVELPEEADLLVSSRSDWPAELPILHPRELVVGVGCNRGTPEAELAEALVEALAAHGLARQAVRNLASIDLKKDEPGLLAFAHRNNWRLDFYPAAELNSVQGFVTSQAVFKATGAYGVAEPAACLSAGTDTLIMEKKKWPNVTLALARANFTLSAQVRAASNI